MQQIPDAKVPQKSRRVGCICCFVAFFLLLGAFIFTIIQKNHEGGVAIMGATGGAPQQPIQNAQYWAKVSFATIILAISFCGIALWLREDLRWTWKPLIVLFFLYVMLQLLLV